MAKKPREGWPIPNVIDPPETMQVTLCVPKNRDHLATFFGALHELTMWNNWMPDAAHSGKELAQVWLRYFYSWDRNLNDCECCEENDMGCCTNKPTIHRFDPVTGRPQISTDNGATWQDDPADTQNAIPLLPPPVGGGGSSTKCDAATNASEHINELITATSENIGTATDVFSLAVAVAEAALGLFLILVSAGTLTAPVVAVATAIWAAATGVANLGKDAFDAYWTTDKEDEILCSLYCTIGENGQFTEEQYQAFFARIKEKLPASPALTLITAAINAGGARGLSQMASYGNAAEADCNSCHSCTEGCVDNFVAQEGQGIEVARGEDWIDIQAINAGGVWYAAVTSNDMNVCCDVSFSLSGFLNIAHKVCGSNVDHINEGTVPYQNVWYVLKTSGSGGITRFFFTDPTV